MRREHLYLADIVEAGNAIARFLSGVDRTTWDSDELLQSAVLHQLMIIGEAAARLGPANREAIGGVPWTSVVGFRNFVVHQYVGLDPDIVWQTATVQVPILREAVARHIAEEEE